MRGHGGETEILTVGELTAHIRGMLGTTFGDVLVRGEISQPRTPGSGHVYLTLKDADAVLPAVIWRSTAARLRFRPEEGQEVLAAGGIDVYPPHGRYQLIIRSLEPVGEGALQLAFEQLRARLEAEGLFDPARKQPLPALPRRIALVTSATGAAVRDMVSVIQRRFPTVTLLLLPVRVQGEGAAAEIAAALAFADAHAQADVLIVGRGGGSLEDLWAFNEEVVARAIASCRTPVVSAVGHETDTTIADLVADVRAATPSQAGELVVPLRDDLLRRLDEEQERLGRRMQVRIDRAWQRLEALGDRPVLRSGRGLLDPRRERLAHLGARLDARSPRASLRRKAEHVRDLGQRLRPPLVRQLARGREDTERLGAALGRATRQRWERADARLGALRDRLRALSPLSVLGRGYSLTTRVEGEGVPGGVVRGADDVEIGTLLDTRLSDGAVVRSRVEDVRKEPS